MLSYFGISVLSLLFKALLNKVDLFFACASTGKAGLHFPVLRGYFEDIMILAWLCEHWLDTLAVLSYFVEVVIFIVHV